MAEEHDEDVVTIPLGDTLEFLGIPTGLNTYYRYRWTHPERGPLSWYSERHPDELKKDYIIKDLSGVVYGKEG